MSSNFGGSPPSDQVDDYMQDFREKRKLLVRWSLYFPLENVREFDVRECQQVKNIAE